MSNTISQSILSLLTGHITEEGQSKGGKRIVKAKLPDGGFVTLYVGTASAVKQLDPSTVTVAERVKPAVRKASKPADAAPAAPAASAPLDVQALVQALLPQLLAKMAK
jgi:hypothetical protein